MAGYSAEDIRTVAIAGHSKSGKTTLLDGLLYKAGATSRLGNVDDGTSICDFDPEEKERKITITAKVAHCNWQKKVINVLDTPGYSDFVGEMLQAFAAADAVIVAVSAVGGIQVNTRRAWHLAGSLPKAVVITQLDMENANPLEVLDNIRKEFGRKCVPFFLPAGDKLVDVLNLPPDLPAQIADRAKQLNTELVEAVVGSNDKLMERYLEGEKLSPADMGPAVRSAMVKGEVVPIFFAAARKEMGLTEILDSIATYFPHMAIARQFKAKKGDQEIVISAEGEFVGLIFKCLVDPFVGKVSYMKVLGGTFTPDSRFVVSRTGKQERIGAAFKPQGKEQVKLDAYPAGDIVGITKVDDLRISDTVTSVKDANPIMVEPLVFPVPVVSRACEPKTRTDEQKISTSLGRLAEQDPTFLVGRDRQTKELIVTGMSDLHLEILMNKMKRTFDVDVTLKEPKIPYQETITTSADGHHRHKKQTGGRGQFGEVYLRVEPLERGKGFEFVDAIVGAAIPNQFIPGVEKGVLEAMEQGVIAGYPVQDVKVTLYDGSHHPVDSAELSFKIAGAAAFKEACLKARPVLLEPIVVLEVTIPSKFVGDVTSDLNGRRGRILGFEPAGPDTQIIRAHVPLAELTRYSSELRSITGGEGSYTLQHSHYDMVPPKIQEQIVAMAARDRQEKKE